MRLQFSETLRRQCHAVHHKILLGAKLNQIKSAKCREDLVLAADLIIHQMPLDMDGLARQLLVRDKFTFEGVKRLQERYRECGRRTESRERRQISHIVQL